MVDDIKIVARVIDLVAFGGGAGWDRQRVKATNKATAIHAHYAARLAEAEAGKARRNDELLEVIAALYKAWPDAEDISSDWPHGIIGSIEQIIAERDEARADSHEADQALTNVAGAALVAEAGKARLREAAQAAYCDGYGEGHLEGRMGAPFAAGAAWRRSDRHSIDALAQDTTHEG